MKDKDIAAFNAEIRQSRYALIMGRSGTFEVSNNYESPISTSLYTNYKSSVNRTFMTKIPKAKIILASLFLMITGCKTNALIVKDDLDKITIQSSNFGPAVVTLESGEVEYGTSEGVVFIVGTNVVFTPTTSNPDWGFGLNDQEQFTLHLIDELKRNKVFSDVSIHPSGSEEFKIILRFNQTRQIEDKGVYHFDVSLIVCRRGEERLNKFYQFKANDETQEYWIGTTYRAAKARAANRLLERITTDLKEWISQESA